MTHRIAETTAKSTLTRCGIEIPKKDLPSFSLSIWAVDIDCPDCSPKRP